MKQSDGEVVRECLLFESGEYPDRELVIADEDLLRIATNSLATIPVEIEHVSPTPFSGALGTITDLNVRGKELWGNLRQSPAAWKFVCEAGARSLSIALDPVRKCITEVSFVRKPRVARAQVFRDDGSQVRVDEQGAGETSCAYFYAEISELKEVGEVNSVRQFAEGLIGYLRGVTAHEGEISPAEITMSEERAAIDNARRALQGERVEQQILAFKQQGLIRAGNQAESAARAILESGSGETVRFGETEISISALFGQFLKANGSVVPMGEIVAADPTDGAAPGSRLIAMAEEACKRDGVPFHAALSKVAAANPELARSARDESYQ